MRYCGWCGLEFGVLRHIFLRGDFCSRKCFEDYKREEALRLRWEAQHGDLQSTVDSPPTAASTDDARAAIWSGILHAARYLGKRDLALNKRRRPPVVLLQEGEGVPLYVLNAGLVDFRLAQLIPGHRMYGLEIPWPAAWRRAAAKNESAQLPTMEQFVAPYVAAIRKHAGDSPCLLAGYSFGGLMAFEAAHQIRRQGGNVQTVILLDAAAQYPKEHELAWRRLCSVWKPSPNERASTGRPQSFGRRLVSSGSILVRIAVKQLRDVAKFLIITVLRDPGQLAPKTDEMSVPLHWRLITRLYDNTLVGYNIRPLNCRGILFRPPPDEDDSAFRMLGDNLGWDDAFTAGLEVIEVTGTHRTMMDQEEHTRVLARALNEVLERACHRGAVAQLQRT